MHLQSFQLEAAQSRASSRASAAPSTVAQKLNVLTKQREALEKELQSLSEEVERLVSFLLLPARAYEILMVWHQEGHFMS